MGLGGKSTTAGPGSAAEEVGPSGLARWIDSPTGGEGGPSWRVILENWRLVEADLHEVYGIDTSDTALMAGRPWRWLAQRIVSLLDRPPILVGYQSGDRQKFRQVPSTRIGLLLNPPKFE